MEVHIHPGGLSLGHGLGLGAANIDQVLLNPDVLLVCIAEFQRYLKSMIHCQLCPQQGAYQGFVEDHCNPGIYVLSTFARYANGPAWARYIGCLPLPSATDVVAQ